MNFLFSQGKTPSKTTLMCMTGHEQQVTHQSTQSESTLK